MSTKSTKKSATARPQHRPQRDSIYQLKITLANTKPPIWRRVEVPDCSLITLHDVIQTAMGWEDCHLYSFEVDGESYADLHRVGEAEDRDAASIRLSDLVKEGCLRIGYTYDFGDDWQHLIEIEKTFAVQPGAKYPRCTAGKRACPPEDCGGPWGYLELLDSLSAPVDDDDEGMSDWLDRDFDPEAFQPESVNKDLSRIK